jgi:hypothetical protein
MNHWPEQGEIDIIENVNSASFSEQTLHAGPVFPGIDVNTAAGDHLGDDRRCNSPDRERLQPHLPNLIWLVVLVSSQYNLSGLLISS